MRCGKCHAVETANSVLLRDACPKPPVALKQRALIIHEGKPLPFRVFETQDVTTCEWCNGFVGYTQLIEAF
jgi:hypothetical protein